MIPEQANRLLGYPVDARLLIINADDLGMCHAINEAVFLAFNRGILCSTTLMVPCPWALHVMHLLANHPEIPSGIHLTAISDWSHYPWGPIAPREKVPSLFDKAGYFYDFDQMHAHLASVELSQLEIEFRAQIETVLAAGLYPTHLDWHAIRLSQREQIYNLMVRLAKEYRLALQVMERTWIEGLQNQGFPTNDFNFLDSYLLDPDDKLVRYQQMLRTLPAGLNEWAVHPGLGNAELLAIENDSNHVRQTDYEFLISLEAKSIIKEEGINLLNYREIQFIWNKVSGE